MGRRGPHVDGGWAWVIVAGMFIKCLISGGFAKSYGIFFSAFTDTFGRSASATQLVRSARSLSVTLTGPVATALSERFTERTVVMAGGLVMAMGYILAFFVDSLEMLIFTFGVFSGVGMTLVNGPAKVCLGRYFDKRRGLANSCSLAGTAVGQVLIPPLVSFLMATYAMRGTMLIYGGICLNIIVVGALMRPIGFKSDSVREMTTEARERSHSDPGKDTCKPLSRDCNENALQKQPIANGNGKTIDVDVRNSTVDTNGGLKRRFPSVCEDNTVKDSYPKFVGNGIVLKNREIPTNVNAMTRSESSIANKFIGWPCALCLRLLQLFAQVFDVALLTNHLYALFIVCTGLCLSSTANQVTFIVPWAIENGLSAQKSAMLISLIGALGIFGNLIWGFLVDIKFLAPGTLMSIGMLCTSVCVLAMSYLRSFQGMAAAAVMYGLFGNSQAVLNLVVMEEFIGMKNLPKAVGMSLFFYGGINMVLAPLLGLVKDYCGTYSIALVATASLQAISALLLIGLEPVARGASRPPGFHIN